MSSQTPTLNWKEIELLADSVRAELTGLFVDKIVVPERPRFTAGYLKGEWAIRLTGPKRETTFLFSIRARHPYFASIPGKGPRAAALGTHSAFDLAMSKTLKGAKLLSLEVAPKERTILLWFSGEGSGKVALALNLIPSAPEALLLAEGDGAYPILTRSKFEKERAQPDERFVLPDGSKAPAAPEIREDLIRNSRSFLAAIEEGLESEAFELRQKDALKALRERLKQARERVRQSETAINEAERESDWQRYGDLLKNFLSDPPPLSADQTRSVLDYETGETVSIPCDPKLQASEQVRKFYHLAKRKARRIEEARSRVETFGEAQARIEKNLEVTLELGDWKTLETLERAAQTGPQPGAASGKINSPVRREKSGGFLGKIFHSKEGFAIWVGRSKDENLELTFKHARGNDVWMHVRGRPGAHVVIPVQPGKSVPLETLLDGAALAIHYSNGQNWGKTEVDYTFKKHVKRIKDSTEASYVHNKTLLLEPSPERIKRLHAVDQ